MRDISVRSWCKSIMGVVMASLALSSCSAPDRLENDDISLNATKSIVKDRLISPIENERIVEFNKKIPRRSILQVIHSSQSLTDPTFIQLIENQLSEEINFRKLQNDLAGVQQAVSTEPKELSEEAKAQIIKRQDGIRLKYMFDKGLELERDLFLDLRNMEIQVDELFLKTVPFTTNATDFPEVIGANLTEDPNGYLSLPADVFLIGGENSTFSSKTAAMGQFVEDKDINLSVRQIPLQDVLGIIANSLGIEYTLSPLIQQASINVSLSLRSGALSILDAILTQNSLAILYDSNLDIARFYTDAELAAIDLQIKAAIRGHNQLLFNKKNLARAEADLNKIKSMIDISQQLLSCDDKAFNAGIKGFPRSAMGEIATKSLQRLSDENFALKQHLERHDEETASLLDPSKQTMTNELRQQASGMSLNDILVESACVETGKEIFVEKIAVYNASREDAVAHLEAYFNKNASLAGATNNAQAQPEAEGGADADAAEQAEEGEGTEAPGGEVTLADPDTQAPEGEEAEQAPAPTPTAASNSDCPQYQVTFQEDMTGIIIRGRRYDNSLAVRLIEEYDVPRLQVLVEIFMVTVSRDFNRQISNLITRAVGGVGGNNISEAALRATQITTDSGSIQADTLLNISSAIEGGYSVQLNSAKADDQGSLISSALSFIESNQLGRVLSSPTILVQDDTETASIKREQVAKLIYQEQENDNGTITTRLVEAEEKAPFELTLNDIKVFPANRTVRMGVKILNKRFTEANINNITTRDQADYTEDTIETAFTAAPGDVIVLAGLAANSDTTATRGLPGTTGGLAPVSPLLGGSDQITSNVSEMIIFMAPTVIDPSSDFQPHSAFGQSDVTIGDDEGNEP
ncbi:MAG: type II secretion system protein GspD [Candidatus Puniceispirillaceae bacterium]